MYKAHTTHMNLRRKGRDCSLLWKVAVAFLAKTGGKVPGSLSNCRRCAEGLATYQH